MPKSPGYMGLSALRFSEITPGKAMTKAMEWRTPVPGDQSGEPKGPTRRRCSMDLDDEHGRRPSSTPRQAAQRSLAREKSSAPATPPGSPVGCMESVS